MTRLTKEALNWLIEQPEFSIHRDAQICCIVVGNSTSSFRDRNTEDAICAAYEELFAKEARAEIRAEERDVLPDYTQPNHD